jgi:RNA polymerase sigma-70 factor, ECF subfamily
MSEATLDVKVFMDREAPPLLDYFVRRVDHIEDAADLLSDTLMIVWRRSRQLPDDPTKARMWLYGVARNVLATHRRGAARRNALASRLRDDLAQRPASVTDDADRDAVRSAIGKLNRTDQEIVGLVYWEGFSLEEVAKISSLRPATVRSRLARARAKLRDLLEKELGDD